MRKKIIRNIISLFIILFISQTQIFSQERSINLYYNEIGIDNKGITRIENLLTENGIEHNNMKVAKKCILEIMKNIPEGFNNFELNTEYKEYLIKEQGIKPSQIEILKRIALRISLRNKEIAK